MSGELVIEPLCPAREPEALALVRAVFNADVAPGFSEEGRATFHEFVRLFAFSRRPADAFALTARRGDALVGVVEVVEGSHVALLFVDSARQRCGVGAELVRRAAAACLKRNPGLDRLTVNASPNAVDAYRRMGFLPTDREQEKNGIRFVPMALSLLPGDDE